MSDTKTDAQLFDEHLASLNGATTEPAAVAPEPAQEAPPDTATEGDTAEVDEFDPSTLPEPARKRWEALEQQAKEREEIARQRDEANGKLGRLTQDYQAVHGRLAPMQRRLAELEATPKGKPTPTNTASSDSFSFDSPEWKTFAQQHPHEAQVQRTAIESLQRQSFARVQEAETRLAAMAERLDREVAPRLEAFDSFRQQQMRASEMSTLNAAHPDWQSVVSSPGMTAWLESQPERVRDLVNSPNADECIWLLDTYKRVEQINQLQAQSQAATEAGNKQAARRRSLETAVTPNVGPTAGGSRAHPVTDADVFDAHMAALNRR